jgi:hypothetical protein
LVQHLATHPAVHADKGGIDVHAAAEMVTRGAEQERPDFDALDSVESIVECVEKRAIRKVDWRIVYCKQTKITLSLEMHERHSRHLFLPNAC